MRRKSLKLQELDWRQPPVPWNPPLTPAPACWLKITMRPVPVMGEAEGHRCRNLRRKPVVSGELDDSRWGQRPAQPGGFWSPSEVREVKPTGFFPPLAVPVVNAPRRPYLFPFGVSRWSPEAASLDSGSSKAHETVSRSGLDGHHGRLADPHIPICVTSLALSSFSRR